MTATKVRKVLAIYRERFRQMGIKKIDCNHENPLNSPELGLAHCYGMLDKIEGFIRENRMDKAFRWLGFIQGFLWAQSLFSLEELKNHNWENGE